jgi:thioredoxin
LAVCWRIATFAKIQKQSASQPLTITTIIPIIMATIVNTQSFKELAAQDGLLVVDFFATWCGPCKKLSPILDEVAEEFAGKANIVKVDIDESEDLAVEFGIRSVPTVLFLKGGQVVDKFVGAVPKSEIVSKVQAAL